MTRIFFYLLLLAMPVSLTFANPLPQWEFSAAAAADDMPGKVMQKSEFLLSADFLAIQDDTNLLAGSYDKKLPNSGSNNLVVGGGGINLPLLVADEGFRLFNDPKDQRPVLEIDPNPAKIPPPNTPAGLCSTTSLIGLCCDDNKDTSQTLRVNCEPFNNGHSAACTKTNANIACCKRYIPENIVHDSYQPSTLIAMEWTSGGVGSGCVGSEKYPETNLPTNMGAPEPYPATPPKS